MATGRPGYDSPARTREEDDLDRWRFASDIVETITTTPSDWSVRVGVFGKWGEGKSSVLHFIERMLEDDGHLVFWFNPWAVTPELCTDSFCDCGCVHSGLAVVVKW